MIPFAAAGDAPGPWDETLGRLRETFEAVASGLPALVAGLVVLLVFALAGTAARALVRRLAERRRRGRNVALVLGRLTQGFAIVLGILVACVIVFPNYTPTKMLEFLGIGSVAIGFVFRDVLQNYLAGILILLAEPFRIGDQIVFKEYEGTIEEVQTRATTMMTYDGRRVVIPNADLLTNTVIVNTAYGVRRLEYDLGIGYGDDIESAKRVILEELGRLDAVIADPPPDVLTWDLGQGSVALRVRWWIHPPLRKDALDARDQVLTALKRALLAHGIDIPFPTTQVLFHDQTDDGDGDRRRQREGWPAGESDRPPPPRTIAGAILELARATPNRPEDSARR